MALNVGKSGGLVSVTEYTWLSWLHFLREKKPPNNQNQCQKKKCDRITVLYKAYCYFDHKMSPWLTCKYTKPDDFKNGTHSFDELVCIISSEPLFHHRQMNCLMHSHDFDFVKFRYLLQLPSFQVLQNSTASHSRFHPSEILWVCSWTRN